MMAQNKMDIKKKNEEYKRKIVIRNTAITVVCAVLLAISFVVSMDTGYTKWSLADVFRVLSGNGTDAENLILFDFRIPRIVISMMVGTGLALSGCVIQSVSGNSLAEPGLLGINAGAGLIVILYVMLFGSQAFLSVFTLPFLALMGAGISAVLTYLLAHKKGKGIAPTRLILVGLAMQAGISALTTVLVISLDENQYSFVASWQAGSIWGSNWSFVLALFPWLLVCIPLVFFKSSVLDILGMGTDTACGLGVSVERERRKLLMLAVALAASCVAVSGSISFVGLVVPHLARRLVGNRHKVLLPVCAIAGAVLVSAADTIARIIVQPDELPTGILVAIIGAPYFLYLLAKSK